MKLSYNYLCDATLTQGAASAPAEAARSDHDSELSDPCSADWRWLAGPSVESFELVEPR